MTTRTSEQVRKPLPESLMKAVRLVLADGGGKGGMTRQERFEAVAVLVTGFGLLEQATTVDPSRLAIPEPQWTEISQMLTDMGKDTDSLAPLEAVGWALDWMNIGPSAYKPEEGQ